MKRIKLEFMIGMVVLAILGLLMILFSLTLVLGNYLLSNLSILLSITVFLLSYGMLRLNKRIRELENLVDKNNKFKE